jgi:hypothetical protein
MKGPAGAERTADTADDDSAIANPICYFAVVCQRLTFTLGLAESGGAARPGWRQQDIAVQF